MIRSSYGKIFAATLALSATGAIASATPAAANHASWHHGKQARISAHHHAIWRQAYRAGYNRGWHAAHVASVGPVASGRSAAVDPVVLPFGYGGPFAGDGLLGTGVLDGRGVAGTGVLSGSGLLGIGIAGF